MKGSVGVPDDRLSYVTSGEHSGQAPTTNDSATTNMFCSAPIRVSPGLISTLIYLVPTLVRCFTVLMKLLQAELRLEEDRLAHCKLR